MFEFCQHFISAVPLLSDVRLTVPGPLEGWALSWKGLLCAIALIGALGLKKRIPTRDPKVNKKNRRI